MIPFLLRRKLVSFKVETSIILGIVIVLLILPGAAVASVTNVKALVGSGSDGGSGIAQLYTGSSPADNAYDWGNCTYWVFILRQKAGDPIPNNWGNAADWALNARLQGYGVDQVPMAGAIMQISDVDNGLGHVAYVTNVDPDTGTWTISEMNVKGLDIVDTKTHSANDALGFNFIHDKER